MESRGLLSRLLEATILLAVCAYLLRLAACSIRQALPVVLLVLIVAVGGYVAYRIWKNNQDVFW